MLALAAVAAALFVLAMMLGSFVLSPGEVVAATLGLPAEPSTVFVVRELRLPRAATAVLVGFALGASGAIFQRVLGNPLASPDFLGVSSGAGAATVAAIVFGNAAGLTLSITAVLGALATSVLIAAVAWHRGVSGYRFILVGIGVSAFMASVTSYLISRAEITDARSAMTWLVGSIGMASPTDLAVLAVAVGGLLVLSPLISRRLGVLELGDAAASALGARRNGDRIFVMAVAVVLVALATAAAGPIAFVALMAGPISARILGSAGSSVIAAALVGAVVMQAADLAAQHALPVPISTGIVTGLVGAPYIAWLIVSANRSGAAG